ncbi:MAG: NapC/NirT family cytochrome c [Ignavibacterium sp.]|nr:MAG: NapC/NirT family cytochrome c [Ignavibacterium sp.]
MKKLLPQEVYNPLTIFGVGLAALSFGIIIFLSILEYLSDETHPYMGIITFIILPIFLVIGVFTVIFGIVRERNRIKKGLERSQQFPILNLNDPRERRLIFIFSVGTILFLFFSAFGSFKAFEYTETDEFCGLVCHTVMEPEYTAYLTSPHSRVGCVNCHIGSGAAWFVRAKISGSYQVYSVLFNKYSKPIPTPVKELRPAEGTCEQCHSPEHFFSEIKYEADYYLYDEENTKSSLSMLLKIGGGNSELGRTEGIHWHMNVSNKMEYIHTDEGRAEIPWVKVTSKDGSVKIFRDIESDFDENNYNPKNLRVMDCIDCHNRPSHIYYPADKSVNLSLSLGRIDESLPYIKSVAVEALENTYSSKEAGIDSISISVNDFYKSNYPSVYADKKNIIEDGIVEVQKIYNRNYFPSMGVNWREFPNHISHLYDEGCFRCHDGNHVSDEGEIIGKNCDLCHTIISQTTGDGEEIVSLSGIDFIHPEELDIDVEELICVDCHARK